MPLRHATRTYKLASTSGSCPNGVVTQLDADSSTDGLQATATIAKGGSMGATLVARLQLQNITTTSSKNPYRCTFDVSVVAIETDPDLDDANNTENNTTTVDLEGIDVNDY